MNQEEDIIMDDSKEHHWSDSAEDVDIQSKICVLRCDV